MKIPDSELNKALKKLLQHSVGSYAVAPRAAIDAHIFQALHHKRMAKVRSRKRLARMSKIGLVFLFGLSVSLFIGPINQTSMRLLKRVKTVAQSVPTQLQSRRDTRQSSAQPTVQSITSDSMEASYFRDSHSNRQAKTAATPVREPLPTNLLTKGPPEPPQLTFLTMGKKTDGLHKAGRVTPSRRHQRLVRVNGKRSGQQPTPVNALGGSKQTDKPRGVEQGPSVRDSNYLTEDDRVGPPTDSVSPNPTSGLASLEPLTALSFAHRLIAPAVEVVPPPVPDAQTTLGRPLTRIEKTAGLHWLVTITPLTTRQRVILLPNPQARVQDVRFPQGLIQSVGYKLNMGLEQNGFQLLLSYTQLRMRSDYAYSTDQYVVEENGSQYRVKRIGTPATTATSLQLAGVAIRKQLDVNHRLLGRFFGSIGLEYCRSLNAAPHHLLFVSASLGKTIRLKRGPSLYIGPYVDYSVNKLQPIDQLQIRPYQAGLSLAFKLGQLTY